MRYLALGLVLAAMLVTPHVHAGDAAAEALFRSGRQAAEAGDFATACARFEESNRLEPAAGTVFNIAFCREKLGHIASAWQRYGEARDRLSSGDQRISVVEERMRALEPRLPKLTVRLEPGSEGASVLRDGVLLGSASLGLQLPIDPGRHEISVRLDGHEDKKLSFEIAEGEQKEITVGAGAIKPSSPSTAVSEIEAEPQAITTLPPRTSGSSQRTWGFLLGGIGVAGLGASAVWGAMVLSKKNEVEGECVQNVCSHAGVEAAESGRVLSNLSTISFAVGAAALGTGVYLILSAPSGRERARLQIQRSADTTTLRLGGNF